MFLNAAATQELPGDFSGTPSIMRLDSHSWKHGSGLNACLGRESIVVERAARSPKQRPLMQELGKHKSSTSPRFTRLRTASDSWAVFRTWLPSPAISL